MYRDIPIAIAQQAEMEVTLASACNGIVNVSVLAETIRSSHLNENVALEDVERCVLSVALAKGAIVVFDRQAASSNIFPARSDADQVNIA